MMGLMETNGAIGMHVAIPADLISFVEQKLATGRYGSREEFLVQAIEWLREERQQALAGIRQGLEDAAAGRVEPLADALDDLRREFDTAK
jgi:Arc/MetJ-type ribon-helix-helix transcriptional regulator